MSRSVRLAALAAVAAAIVGTPAAQAHVTLQPTEGVAGEFQRFDVRAPNERDRARTTKVEVQFPPGFIFISTEPVADWTARVKMEKLAKPVEVFGERHTEEVDTVTFAATGDGIGPGEFQDFGLSLRTPERARALTLRRFRPTATVRWCAGSAHPTPRSRRRRSS